MLAYFSGNVYAGWFGRLERVLRGMGHGYTIDAVHLDLVQEATDPTWSALGSQRRGEYEALRVSDLPFLGWLLGAFPIVTVHCDGQTALATVTDLLNAQVRNAGTLGKLRISRGCAEVAGRQIALAGWNLTLARGGLTAESERELGRRLRTPIGRD
jgi:hypothetical protein